MSNLKSESPEEIPKYQNLEKKMEKNPEARTSGASGRLRILLAEDMPDNQALMKIYLQSLSADVEMANNGQEAMTKALSSDYDLILMDMMMPVMDGLEATRRLRESGFDKPIIALTAHTFGEEIERSLAAGCTAHLSKPVSRETLLATIEREIRNQAKSHPSPDAGK